MAETLSEIQVERKLEKVSDKLADVKAGILHKRKWGYVKGKALVDTLSDTVAEVVAKTIADTVTGVGAEARVKTEVDSVAGMEAYTVVVTLNKIKADALV